MPKPDDLIASWHDGLGGWVRERQKVGGPKSPDELNLICDRALQSIHPASRSTRRLERVGRKASSPQGRY